jgi:phosphate starvation-inducible membrane PsiE
MKNRLEEKIQVFGNSLVDIFHSLALFVIGGTIVWTAAFEYIDIMGRGVATLSEILLLFIYLELGAMVGIYFKTHRLPVRFLIYIAITALTRLLTVDMKSLGIEMILSLSGAILILALSILVLQFCSTKYRGDDVD